MNLFRNFFIILVILSSAVFAQSKGTIMGKIIDSSSGEEIIGANILIEGTSFGAASDISGNYRISNIDAGTYNLVISYISYSSKKFEDVIVKAGEITTVNVALSSESIELNEVVIVEKADNSYESALLNQQKKSSSVSDGLSAEQIKRSPDATSGDALKRVTGVSLVDNKFIFIRGTSERYSNAMLNNSTLTSSEPDRKSFAFDILPANLLENTVIIKSFTPDVPGDFSGGLVKMNTIDFPSKLTLNVSTSAAYNENTTGEEFSTYNGGNNFWGKDDGTRKIPAGMPGNVNQTGYTAADRNEFAKLFGNVWAPQNKTAPINTNLNISFGDGVTLIGQNFGFVTALTYRNGFNNSSITRNEYEATGERRFAYEGVTSSHNVSLGGLFNLSYKFSDFHKLSIKNTYSRSADDEVTQFQGFQYTDAGAEQIHTALRYVSRSVYSGQLIGEHYFPYLNGLQMQWRGSRAVSYRDEPDYRRIIYQREIDSENPFAAVLGFQANLKNGGRFFSDLSEYGNGFAVDFSMPIDNIKLKFGGLYEDKTREFNSRLIGVIVNASGNGFTNFNLLYYGLDSIFAPENFRRNGFSIDEYRNGSNNYSAFQKIGAGYLMFEYPINIFNKELRIIGGARIEAAEQRVNSRDLTDQIDININLLKTDLFPSLNLVYRLSEESNLRLAYSQTVNRPELRELAPFTYFDFSTQTSIRGNDKLNRALIKNYDVRYEIYPGIGELISASFFYKNITDAIEQVVLSGSSLGAERTFANSDKAINYGFELEGRVSLKHFGGYFSNFSINGNYSWINSSVDVSATEGTIEKRDRPLQGQSPYMINLGLTFVEPTYGTMVSLLYNKFGERILEVATAFEEDIIEQPREVIDIVITQNLISNLELRLAVRDLFGQNQVFKQGDKISRVNSKDRNVSLGLGFKL